MTILSGPPNPDLPYRYGCPCMAIWNSDKPLEPQDALCGPHCAGGAVFLLSSPEDDDNADV